MPTLTSEYRRAQAAPTSSFDWTWRPKGVDETIDPGVHPAVAALRRQNLKGRTLEDAMSGKNKFKYDRGAGLIPVDMAKLQNDPSYDPKKFFKSANKLGVNPMSGMMPGVTPKPDKKEKKRKKDKKKKDKKQEKKKKDKKKVKKKKKKKSSDSSSSSSSSSSSCSSSSPVPKERKLSPASVGAGAGSNRAESSHSAPVETGEVVVVSEFLED